MTREINMRLTDDEIRAHHALPDNPDPNSLGALCGPCQCPVCKPRVKREPVK